MSEPRTALVTGANKGIGYATAEQLARCGDHVLLGARDRDRGARAVNALRAEGLEVTLVELDVADQNSIERAVRAVGEHTDALDVLVSNAGISVAVPPVPSQTPAATVAEVLDVNAIGAVRVVNAFLPLLRRSPAARVVFVSSEMGSLHHLACGDHPMGELPLLLAYNVSKAALNGIALHYAKELAGTPILVNTVTPGYVATDLNGHRGFLTPAQGARVPVYAATLPASGPTGAFLASDGADGVTTVPW